MPATMSTIPTTGTGLAAFGPVASAWAARYPAGLEAIIADCSGAAHGLHEAVQRKRAGKSFFVVPALEDHQVVVTRALAARILTSERKFDHRYRLFEDLDVGRLSYLGNHQTGFSPFDRRALISLRDFMRLGNSLLVRSWTEYQRFTGLLWETPLNVTRALVSSTAIPQWESRFGGKHLVIWAPEANPEDVAIPAFAVENLHFTTYVVCRNPDRSAELDLRAVFVGTDAAAAILQDALAIIVADLNDPGPAVALAQSGVPIAIASTSGAHEYVDGAPMFLPWSARSIRNAALLALGAPPSRVRADLPTSVDFAAELKATEPPVTPDPPLVSILLSTKDRREVLPRALDSIATQTYPNIEILVINDGGEPIADIVARYPSARLIDHQDSKGLVKRLHETSSVAAGKYCVAHSDDDYFFPDHFARCIYAMERTGSPASRPIVLYTLNSPGQDDLYYVVGHTVNHYHAYDPTELLWANNIGIVVQTRQIIFDCGLWSSEPGQVMDWDCFIKLSQVTDLPCIYAVTANFDQRTDQTNMNDAGVAQWVTSVSSLYAAYANPERTYIEEQRAEILARARWDDMSRIQPMRAATPLVPPAPGDYHVFKKTTRA